MSDIAAILKNKGFDSYRELYRWTKSSLRVRKVRDPVSGKVHPNSVKYLELKALWKFRFDLSDEDAKRLIDLFKELGYLEESSRLYILTLKD